MAHQLLKISVLLFVLSLAIGCGEVGGTGLPAPGTPSEDPGSELPPGNGGELSPPGLPAHAYASTLGGYVVLKKIDDYEVTGTPELLGVAETTEGMFFLYERSISYSVKMWDIFKVTEGNSPQLHCTFARPGNSYDRYFGFLNDGQNIRVFAESSYSSWTRLYTLSLSSCTLPSYKTVDGASSYTSSDLLAYFNGSLYYHRGSDIRLWKESTGLISNWNYSRATVAGATPNPMRTTLSITVDNTAWFFDSSRRLWRGTGTGTWDGFVEVPSNAYSDLNYAKFTVVQGYLVKIVTYNKYAGSMKIYYFDTTEF